MSAQELKKRILCRESEWVTFATSRSRLVQHTRQSMNHVGIVSGIGSVCGFDFACVLVWTQPFMLMVMHSL